MMTHGVVSGLLLLGEKKGRKTIDLDESGELLEIESFVHIV
jgi:hypothetical protein